MLKIGGVEIEKLPGLTHPLRKLSTGVYVQPAYWKDDADCDEHWANEKAMAHGGRKSQYWRQNYEMDLLRGGEPVWPMLSREIHVRTIPRAMYLSADWSVWRSLDGGIRHPACCAWSAVHKNGDRYFFRQLYMRDTPIPIQAERILDLSERDEMADGTAADPSLWARNPGSNELQTFAECYAEHGLDLIKADNSRVGYETLTTGFISAIARWCLGRGDLTPLRDAMGAGSVDKDYAERLAAKPAIWFSPQCAEGEYSLYEQTANLCWREHKNPLHTAEPIKPEDINDEGPDVVRYACQTEAVHWNIPRRPGTVDVYDELLAIQKSNKVEERLW